jgi:hypothetical protein
MKAANLILLGSLFLILAADRASAAWPANGRAVSAAPGDQLQPRVASDESDGAIVAWGDLRGPGLNIFARRVFATGELDPAWPVDGRALLADPVAVTNASILSLSMVSDENGGAIVAWTDVHDINIATVHAQHVLSTGVVDPAWPANGRALTTLPGQSGFRPRIAGDGQGGAIITWTNLGPQSNFADVFAQHVLASGAIDPAWPAGGVVMVSATDDQFFCEIVADGSGGAVVTWIDGRSQDGSSDIYAQRVLSNGGVDPAWPVNGRALCIATHDQLNPTIAADGAHGAVVTWMDNRDLAFHIYAQRVLVSGAIAPGWPVDGRAVCTAAPNQKDPRITTDGAGGAVVVWEDYRNASEQNPDQTNPFVQHVLASGAIDAAWPDNGRALSNAGGEASNISLVVDGAGGAIVAWEQADVVMTHHVRATGILDPTFPANGRIVRNIPNVQHSPDLVVSGNGGAIVAWSDGPNDVNFDIYAMNVNTQLTTGVDDPARAPGFTFASPAPNPAQGPVTLRFALPNSAHVKLEIYDVAGRRVRAIANGDEATGEHDIAWDQRDDSGRVVSAGLYFARMEVKGHVLTQKLVTLK